MSLDELGGDKRFEGVRVVLGVTGGIAAYKSCILVRRLVEEGAEVQVVMTSSAQQFITPLTFATLSGRNVLSDMFPQPPPPVPIHLTPAQWGKILIVAPATANFLAQVAQGFANDLLSLITLAFNGPCLLAPAMNSRMWENRAVQDNIKILKERGFRIVGPNWGEMAGVNEEPGWGRMSEPEEILDAAEEALISNPPWTGLRVLVTSGPTRESLDPIRFLSNRSSGKMGDALARQAHLLGAEVFLIRGVGSQNPPPRGPKVCVVESAQEMGKVVKELFPTSHILIMAGAVSDWQPAHFSAQKMKRTSGGLTLQLLPNEDILLWAGKHKTHQVVVGFAVETENHLENARSKLVSKGADIILLNDPTQAHSSFGGETIQLTILTKEGTVSQLPVMSKYHAAKMISKEITSRLKGKVFTSSPRDVEVNPR